MATRHPRRLAETVQEIFGLTLDDERPSQACEQAGWKDGKECAEDEYQYYSAVIKELAWGRE
jgi:hypothetical protein